MQLAVDLFINGIVKIVVYGILFRMLRVRFMKRRLLMKKKDLILKSAQTSGVSATKAASVIDSFLEEVVKALSDGEKIMISGFGTFEVKERAAREGHNPATGEKITIPASKNVGFVASKALKDKVNA